MKSQRQIDDDENQQPTRKRIKQQCEYSMRDIPRDVVYFIYEYSSIDVSQYFLFVNTLPRFRTYCKSTCPNMLIRALFGYFADDPRREIHKLYSTVYLFSGNGSKISDVNTLKFATHFAINYNGQVDILTHANPKNIVAMKTSSGMDKIFLIPGVSAWYNLKHLEFSAPSMNHPTKDDRAQFREIINILKIYKIENLTIKFVRRAADVVSLITMSTLKYLSISAIGYDNEDKIEIPNNYENPLLQTLKMSYLPTSDVLKQVPSFAPNLLRLHTELEDSNDLQFIKNMNIQELVVLDPLNGMREFPYIPHCKLQWLNIRIRSSDDLMLISQISTLKRLHLTFYYHEPAGPLAVLFSPASKLQLKQLQIKCYAHQINKIERVSGLYYHGKELGFLDYENGRQVILTPSLLKQQLKLECYNLLISHHIGKQMIKYVCDNKHKWSCITIKTKLFVDQVLNEFIKAGVISAVNTIHCLDHGLSEEGIYYLSRHEKYLFGGSRLLLRTHFLYSFDNYDDDEDAHWLAN
jgi:hypothetical protein